MSSRVRSHTVRDFGANIAARRHRLGLSQVEVADKIGITQESLSRLESGLAAPKFLRLHALADALQCSVSDLFISLTESERDKGRFFAELIHPLPPVWQDTILNTAIAMARNVRDTFENALEGPDNAADIKEE